MDPECSSASSYVDEVLVGAADDVVVCDGDGVDAAPAGLQDVNALQRADVPNLTEARDRGVMGKSELLNSCKLSIVLPWR